MRKPKDYKYKLKAWSKLSCPVPEGQSVYGCDQICGCGDKECRCIDMEEFQTNNKLLFNLKLFLCQIFHDYIEIITPENKSYEV